MIAECGILHGLLLNNCRCNMLLGHSAARAVVAVAASGSMRLMDEIDGT